MDIKIHCAYDELKNIAEVIPNPRNPNTHPEKQLKLLAKIIEAHGWRAPITVSKRSGFVIRGHGRLMAAQMLGCEVVPIDLQDYASEAEEWADMIADNRIAELSEVDQDELSRLVAELDAGDYDTGLLGFTDKDIASLLASVEKEQVEEDNFDVTGALDNITEPEVKAGDIYQLGRHRLMCGDSTKLEDVQKLMGGELADMIFTDPPYNVAYEGGTDEKLTIQNDNMPAEEFNAFLLAAFKCMFEVTKAGGAIYVFHADSVGSDFRKAVTSAGWSLRQTLIWVKNQFTLGRQDYQWQHEPCQPPGTLITMPSGAQIPIEKLKDGDRVLSYDKYSGVIKGYKEGLPVKVANRHYNGTLYGIKVGDKQTWATDNHRFTVKFHEGKRKLYCVYLMRRGRWWRVGNTVTYDARGFGLKQRLRQEKADEAWILDVFHDKLSAQCGEQLVCVKYGLPYTHWEVERGLKEKSEHIRSKEQIQWIYDNLDLGELEQHAENALAAYGRLRKYPFVTKETLGNKMSTRVTSDIRACNIIPEIMEVPIPYEKYNGVKTFEWRPVDAVDRKPYNGSVYSLQVDTYEHYIADGIVTHNCLYGWKPGAGHNFYGGRRQGTVLPETYPVTVGKDVDGKTLLTISFGLRDLKLRVDNYEVVDAEDASTLIFVDKPTRNGEHPTMKPIALCAKAISNSSRKDDIVLDLFGGSGSTLIAAEQIGRSCCTMELDPRYAQVILNRFKEFTGKDPVKLN